MELALVIATISLVKDVVAVFNPTKNFQPHGIAGIGVCKEDEFPTSIEANMSVVRSQQKIKLKNYTMITSYGALYRYTKIYDNNAIKRAIQM